MSDNEGTLKALIGAKLVAVVMLVDTIDFPPQMMESLFDGPIIDDGTKKAVLLLIEPFGGEGGRLP